MARTKKTVHKGFSYRNCDDFAAYLNHMGRQGWHFREWRAGLVFETGEPEDSFYAVEIFTKAEEGDTRPVPETREFAEYCEAAGWEFVDAWRKFVVFKRIRPDAVPIMTDEERFQNVVKAENRSIWHPVGYSAIWCAMKLSEFGTSTFAYRIFSPFHVFMMAFWIGLFLISAFRAVHFLLWKRSCCHRMEDGLPLFLGRNQADKWFDSMHALILILFSLSMLLTGETLFALTLLGIFVAIYLMSYIISKFRLDSATSGLIQILGIIAIIVGICFSVFYVDQERRAQDQIILEPPLTYADIGIEMPEPNIRYSKEDKTIFGANRYANLDYGNDYLFYSLYTTDMDWVMDKLWKIETKGKANETRDDCTEAWDALEAFRNGAGNYIVRYADALWVISPSLEEPLTQEQIDAIVAALKED